MFNLRDKIRFGVDLILDTFFSLIDISQISEDDYDRTLEKKEFNIIAAEDQNYLKKLRKRNGKYRTFHKGKWFRDLGYCEDLEFIGRDPE
jgi:hypothetical protein